MISTLSRTGCVLYFVNSRLAPDLGNHIQYVIFVHCYQHIVDAVVVVNDLRDSAKSALELMTLLLKIVQEFPECWVVRGNLCFKTSMPSFYAVICSG